MAYSSVSTYSRPSYRSLEDLVDDYMEANPDASEDEAFDAVVNHMIPDRMAASIDAAKESRRENI